jgi:hypothetical protein
MVFLNIPPMVALLKDISLDKPVRCAPARAGADHLYSKAALTTSLLDMTQKA